MAASCAPLDELLEIMRALRDPEKGCAWDIRQSFATIAPFTIEEAYEVADAIERNDLDDLKDELGDLLFQVVFHAQMASEQRAFDFDDVARSIVDKMIRRHPHVFGDKVFESEEGLKASWDATKALERKGKQSREQAGNKAADGLGNSDINPTEPLASALDGIAGNLPALVWAEKIQKRAARSGFDWPSIGPVWQKLDEELEEVRKALETDDKHAVEDEIGDLLFTVVNLARHCSIDSEVALRRASRKFAARFRRVEWMASERNTDLSDLDLDSLDILWTEAKQRVD